MKFSKIIVAYCDFPKEHTLEFHINEDNSMTLDDESKKIICDYIDVNLEPMTITCIGLMGGDKSPKNVVETAKFIKERYPDLHIGWYSSNETFPAYHGYFDFIKLGKPCDEYTMEDEESQEHYYVNIDMNNNSRDFLSASFIDMTRQLFRDFSNS